jgi:2-polyprenyl-3-methyl-5-hydroxy-6-metoxy-1,4-benzoquinol methylase
MAWWRALLRRPRETYSATREQLDKGRDLVRRLSLDVAASAEVHQATLRALWEIDQRLRLTEQVALGQLDAAIADRPELLDTFLRRLIDDPSQTLPTGVAELLSFEYGYKGWRARDGLWINPPLSIAYGENGPVLLEVNERIVEIPFALAAAMSLPPGSTIVDLGAAESTIALSLASLGYRVTALDVRGYEFDHPNLQVVTEDALSWEPQTTFDAITCISTVEHVGLGYYGDGEYGNAADREVLTRMREWLRPDGLLVLTVPFGMGQIAEHQRTYDPDSLDKLLDGWTVDEQRIFVRVEDAWRESETTEWSGVGVALVRARCPTP